MTSPFADSTFLALLAACRADPEDDVPRVALSEWLQERDNPWGDFISLQLHHHWGLEELTGRREDRDEHKLVRRQGTIDEPVDEEEEQRAERRRITELVDLYSRSLKLKKAHWREWVLGLQVDPPVAHRLVDGDSDAAAPTGPRVSRAFGRQRDFSPHNKVQVFFSRGMISAVRCRRYDWWGTECSLCQGLGHVSLGPRTERHPFGAYMQLCARCCGLGRINALGPILARHPINLIRVFDFQFERVGNRAGLRCRQVGLLTDGLVPDGVFYCACEYRNGCKKYDDGRAATWRDEEVAKRALEFGMLRWARDKGTIANFARQNERPPAMGRPTEPGSAVTPQAEQLEPRG